MNEKHTIISWIQVSRVDLCANETDVPEVSPLTRLEVPVHLRNDYPGITSFIFEWLDLDHQAIKNELVLKLRRDGTLVPLIELAMESLEEEKSKPFMLEVKKIQQNVPCDPSMVVFSSNDERLQVTREVFNDLLKRIQNLEGEAATWPSHRAAIIEERAKFFLDILNSVEAQMKCQSDMGNNARSLYVVNTPDNPVIGNNTVGPPVAHDKSQEKLCLEANKDEAKKNATRDVTPMNKEEAFDPDNMLSIYQVI